MVRRTGIRLARHTAASPLSRTNSCQSGNASITAQCVFNHMAGPVGLAILGVEGRLIEEVIADPVWKPGGRGEGIGLLHDILEDIIHFRGHWVALSA